MARPLRIQKESNVYLVSNYCFQDRFLLQPSLTTNALILGWLARAACLYNIKIYFFIFMSNHFHIGLQAPDENLHNFMGYFQSNLSSNLNKVYGRKDPVFPVRYRSEVLLEEDMILHKMIYTLQNPVRAGLVERAEDWPGLSSLSAHLSSNPIECRWTNNTTLRNIRRRKYYCSADDQDAQETYLMWMARPPTLESLEQAEFANKLQELINTIVPENLPDNEDGCPISNSSLQAPPVIGLQRIREQHPFSRPVSPRRSPRSLCCATNIEIVNIYLLEIRKTTKAYRKSMRLWRCQAPNVRFPLGTIPPGWKRCVRAYDLKNHTSSEHLIDAFRATFSS